MSAAAPSSPCAETALTITNPISLQPLAHTNVFPTLSIIMSSSLLCRRQLLRHSTRLSTCPRSSHSTITAASPLRPSNSSHNTQHSSSQQHAKRSTVLFTTTAVAGLSGAILYNQFISSANDDTTAAHAAGRLNRSDASSPAQSEQDSESELHQTFSQDPSSAPSSEAQHAKRSAVQRPKSEPKYVHPQYPGMLRLVADNIDELVYNTPDRLTLVEVYETGCGACATMAPIVQLLAKCFRENGIKVDVALYEGSLNYKPGFLTDEEDRAVPVIKLFTPTSKQQKQGITYDGEPNAKAVAQFIYEQSKSDDKTAFDLEKINDCIKQYEPQYFEKVIKQTHKRLQQDPTAFLYEKSPCGPYMQSWMEMMMSDMYLSNKTPERRKALEMVFNDFRNCITKKEEETIDYWSQVRDVAEQNLSDAVERKKTSDDSVEEAQKNDQPQPKKKRNAFGGSAPRSK